MTTSPTRLFDPWAAEYDRYRPGYPGALFDEIASRLSVPGDARVVDLGAGTGIATFAMARRGWRVTAVEPGKAMLDQLRNRAASAGLPVEPVESRAESTGLPDAAFHLAAAAQAFHWFDKPRAVAEMARIVRPRGGAALFWNVRRAEASPIVAGYERLIERFFGDAGIGQYLQHGREAEEAAIRAAFASSDAFGDVTYTEPRHETEVDAESFIGMAFTASYVRRLDLDEQARFRSELESLLAANGVRHETFSIPYRIELWTARRSDR